MDVDVTRPSVLGNVVHEDFKLIIENNEYFGVSSFPMSNTSRWKMCETNIGGIKLWDRRETTWWIYSRKGWIAWNYASLLSKVKLRFLQMWFLILKLFNFIFIKSCFEWLHTKLGIFSFLEFNIRYQKRIKKYFSLHPIIQPL